MSDEKPKMKPLFLVKPGSVTRRDISRAERLAGICIIECAEPESARYQELPMSYDLNDQARAALSLMRNIMTSPVADFKRAGLTKWFIEALLGWQRPANVPVVPAVKR